MQRLVLTAPERALDSKNRQSSIVHLYYMAVYLWWRYVFSFLYSIEGSFTEGLAQASQHCTRKKPTVRPFTSDICLLLPLYSHSRHVIHTCVSTPFMVLHDVLTGLGDKRNLERVMFGSDGCISPS